MNWGLYITLGIVVGILLTFLISVVAYVLGWIIFYLIVKIPSLRKHVFNHIDKSLNQAFDNFNEQCEKGYTSAYQCRKSQIVKYLINDYFYFIKTNIGSRKTKVYQLTNSISESGDKKRLESLIYVVLYKLLDKGIPKLSHADNSRTSKKGLPTSIEQNRT